MTIKQQKAIKLAEYFSKDGYGSLINIPLREDSTGKTPEEAFLMKSETGKLPDKVTDKKRLEVLLKGYNWMAVKATDYTRDFRNGIIELEEYKDEPDFVFEFIKKRYDSVKRKYGTKCEKCQLETRLYYRKSLDKRYCLKCTIELDNKNIPL